MNIEYEEKVKENLATIRSGDYVKIVNDTDVEERKDQELMVISAPKRMANRWYVRIEDLGWIDVGRLERCLEK